MTVFIRAATPTFDASGTPFSQEFADVYHSAASGPGQARHVFLHGNDLPERWRGRHVFTVLETGFGLGLNFLTTWSAWRADPARCQRLHFLSIERHPFSRDDLRMLHERYAELTRVSTELCEAWPPLVPGMQRVQFDQGRVVLTLCFADASAALRELRLAADAFYLDGFAPQRNPEMWTPALMKAIARLAAPGATLATYTTSRGVCDALSAAGFVTEKRAGFAGKREMLAARHAPRWPLRHRRLSSMPWAERSAIIVGAGLAGCAVAERLAARGWRLDVVERNRGPAREASAMLGGVLQPHVSRDDAILSRFSRAGFLYALRQRQAIAACGVLQLALGAGSEVHLAHMLSTLAYPSDYADYRTREEASELAGRRVGAGGCWFPAAGWTHPQAVAAAHIAAAKQRAGERLCLHFGRDVAALRRHGERWQTVDARGGKIAEAEIVILANARNAARFADLDAARLQQIRGQLTLLPTREFAAPRCVVSGGGYVLPAVDGIAVAGASYDIERADASPDAAGHEANLRRVEELLPGSTEGLERQSLVGQVGFRCAAPDRLPMVGPIVDVAAARANASALIGAHLHDLPRTYGLYGAFAYASRGLAWSLLAAEALASQLSDEPPPLEASLADAIDPGRFALRKLRRATL